MRVRLVRRPGDPGTKRFVARYGDRLLCVRYRYDAAEKRRYTTVELIVESAAWEPPVPPGERLVGVRVAWGEADLARAIKAAGGRWDRQRRVWELPYVQVQALGLLDRIVDDLL